MSTPEVIEIEVAAAIEVIEVETPGLATQAAIDAQAAAEAAAASIPNITVSSTPPDNPEQNHVWFVIV